MAARDSPPLRVVCDQRRERAWIACAERLRCGAKLIEDGFVHIAERYSRTAERARLALRCARGDGGHDGNDHVPEVLGAKKR